jgi:hypothetical protein
LTLSDALSAQFDLPDGQIKRAFSDSKSSMPAKNIPLQPLLKSNVKIRHPVPQEGRFAIVTNVGAGCGGRC